MYSKLLFTSDVLINEKKFLIRKFIPNSESTEFRLVYEVCGNDCIKSTKALHKTMNKRGQISRNLNK